MKVAKRYHRRFFRIERRVIVAHTRQIEAGWTIEPVQDLVCLHSPSIYRLFDKRKLKRIARKESKWVEMLSKE